MSVIILAPAILLAKPDSQPVPLIREVSLGHIQYPPSHPKLCLRKCIVQAHGVDRKYDARMNEPKP
jgi:hypothetical protein